MNAEPAGVEIETESNSTVEPDADVATMSDADKTAKLLQHLTIQRPVTLDGKVPTMVDVRAVVQADFSNADANWKQSVPKVVVSRSGRLHAYIGLLLPLITGER